MGLEKVKMVITLLGCCFLACVLGTTESCPRFEFQNIEGNTLIVKENQSASVQFRVDITSCPDTVEVAISRKGIGPVFDYCRMLYNGTDCWDLPLPGCKCPDKNGLFLFTKNVTQKDEAKWAWYLLRGTKTILEEIIIFELTPETTPVVQTSPNTDSVESGGKNSRDSEVTKDKLARHPDLDLTTVASVAIVTVTVAVTVMYIARLVKGNDRDKDNVTPGQLGENVEIIHPPQPMRQLNNQRGTISTNTTTSYWTVSADSFDDFSEQTIAVHDPWQPAPRRALPPLPGNYLHPSLPRDQYINMNNPEPLYENLEPRPGGRGPSVNVVYENYQLPRVASVHYQNDNQESPIYGNYI